MSLIAGYDVGGANLKVALASDSGELVAAVEIPCPLWRGLDELEAALAAVSPLTQRAERHALTMTGELADVFPDRYTGVVRIVDSVRAAVGARDLQVYAATHGLLDATEAVCRSKAVASANFMATGDLAGRYAGAAVLIDIGSTTTDVMAIREGRPAPRGVTDAERLATGELVYTGLTRTPVMGIAQRAPLAGQWQNLMNEPFATMADVRSVLGALPGDLVPVRSPDGRSYELMDCVARLARCFGCDAEDHRLETWTEAARFLVAAQAQSVEAAVLPVLAGLPQARIVTAGIGAAFAGACAVGATQGGRDAITFGELIEAPPALRISATRYAPAVAVALLAARTARA